MKDTRQGIVNHPEYLSHAAADICPGNNKENHSYPMSWQVYIIHCSDNSLYTGITTDLTRRLHQHAAGRGAKYFRGRWPVKVLYLETGHTRSSASRREAEIKTLTHAAKCRLAATEQNEVADAERNSGSNIENADFRGMLNSTVCEVPIDSQGGYDYERRKKSERTGRKGSGKN